MALLTSDSRNFKKVIYHFCEKSKLIFSREFFVSTLNNEEPKLNFLAKDGRDKTFNIKSIKKIDNLNDSAK